ncbi:phosphatase PAP2 family protein [Neobacillus sp. FSL H8-0543]|uniref:phosphatase PAP2 family protein n=1 Tax=Neobacillus sp. FSL H8-0543 TaxID=2954672 RepID=UPI0031585067
MNLKVQLLWAFFISVGALIGFTLLAIAVKGTEGLLAFDRVVISFVQGLEAPALTTVMKFFTYVGSTKAAIIIALVALYLLYRVQKDRSELILFIIVVAGTPILVSILKNFFQRARPEFHRLIEIGGYSFPSGHSMNAFAIYGMITFLFWRHIPTRLGRTILILGSSVFILMIGTSRVYLGVHYPSDVIGGYLASGFWLSSVIWVYQRYKERRYERLVLSKNPR